MSTSEVELVRLRKELLNFILSEALIARQSGDLGEVSAELDRRIDDRAAEVARTTTAELLAAPRAAVRLPAQDIALIAEAVAAKLAPSLASAPITAVSQPETRDQEPLAVDPILAETSAFESTEPAAAVGLSELAPSRPTRGPLVSLGSLRAHWQLWAGAALAMIGIVSLALAWAEPSRPSTGLPPLSIESEPALIPMPEGAESMREVAPPTMAPDR